MPPSLGGNSCQVGLHLLRLGSAKFVVLLELTRHAPNLVDFVKAKPNLVEVATGPNFNEPDPSLIVTGRIRSKPP